MLFYYHNEITFNCQYYRTEGVEKVQGFHRDLFQYFEVLLQPLLPDLSLHHIVPDLL